MRPIEPLGLADLGGLRELSQAIGWRQTGDDWRTILEVAALGAKPFDDAPIMLHGPASMPGRRDGIYALASRGLG